MTFATKAMDKRWFLDPSDAAFRKWIADQDRKFQLRVYEEHYPELMDQYHASKPPKKSILDMERDEPDPTFQPHEKINVPKILEGYGMTDKTSTIADVMEFVSDRHGISVRELKSRRRNPRFVTARHEAIFIVCEMFTTYSYPMIGRIFGMDHSSILHAHRKVRKLLGMDPPKRSNSADERRVRDKMIRDMFYGNHDLDEIELEVGVSHKTIQRAIYN